MLDVTDSELTIDDLVLACIPRTTYTSEATLWAKYERICERHNCMALAGQCKAALGRLKAAGKIVFAKGKGVKQA
jgi:hypothetical protein